MKHIKRRYIWYFKEKPRVRLFIPYRWLRTFAIYAAVVGLLVFVGSGVYLFVPEPILQSMWERAVVAVEDLGDSAEAQLAVEGETSPNASPELEASSDWRAAPEPLPTDSLGRAGASIGSLFAATQPESSAVSFDSVDAGSAPLAWSLFVLDYVRRDTLIDARHDEAGGIPLDLDSLAWLLAVRHIESRVSPTPVPEPASEVPLLALPASEALATMALADQVAGLLAATDKVSEKAASPTKKATTAPSRRRSPVRLVPITPKSGRGEITIVSLMPEAYVEVDDVIVTEAPTTIEVPWPASYEVSFHVGDSEIYATHVQLSAENHAVSFSVDPEIRAP